GDLTRATGRLATANQPACSFLALAARPVSAPASAWADRCSRSFHQTARRSSDGGTVGRSHRAADSVRIHRLYRSSVHFRPADGNRADPWTDAPPPESTTTIPRYC